MLNGYLVQRSKLNMIMLDLMILHKACKLLKSHTQCSWEGDFRGRKLSHILRKCAFRGKAFAKYNRTGGCGMAKNFMEKTFKNGSQIVKLMKVSPAKVSRCTAETS